ncbi:hypothetical protein D3C80_1910130 [compost metagenome]
MVSPYPVAVGIGVSEQAALQHFVGGGFNAGHERTRREGSLLNFRKIVLRVPVQHHPANLDQRVILL